MMKKVLFNLLKGLFISFIALVISKLIEYFYLKEEISELFININVELLYTFILGVIVGIIENFKLKYLMRIPAVIALYCINLKLRDAEFILDATYFSQSLITICIFYTENTIGSLLQMIKDKMKKE